MSASRHRAYGNRHLDESRTRKSDELSTKRQSSLLQISVCHPKATGKQSRWRAAWQSRVEDNDAPVTGRKERVGGWQRVQLHLLARGGGSGIHKAQSLFPCLLWLSLSLEFQLPILFSVHDFCALSSCRCSLVAGQRCGSR